MTAWLDDLLDPKSFNDFCVNGLCVEANDKVTRIVTGVSLRDQLIDAAIEEKADCIIVHHPNGFWKGESQIPVGKFGERLRKFMNLCTKARGLSVSLPNGILLRRGKNFWTAWTRLLNMAYRTSSFSVRNKLGVWPYAVAAAARKAFEKPWR